MPVYNHATTRPPGILPGFYLLLFSFYFSWCWWSSGKARDCWALRAWKQQQFAGVLNLAVGAHCSQLMRANQIADREHRSIDKSYLSTWCDSVRAADSHRALEQTTKHPICQVADRAAGCSLPLEIHSDTCWQTRVRGFKCHHSFFLRSAEGFMCWKACLREPSRRADLLQYTWPHCLSPSFSPRLLLLFSISGRIFSFLSWTFSCGNHGP